MAANPARIIVKRSLNLSKTYILFAFAIAANSILIEVSGRVLGSDAVVGSGIDIHASLPLISIPLLATGALTLSVPVILLFVYDKNNGVLERFLSLGMSQKEIYRRYLSASHTLTLMYLPLAISAYLVAGLASGATPGLLLQASALLVVLSLSVVTLVDMAMMSFSSLQKQRVGANQPLGIGIGGLLVIPYYAIPFGTPARQAIPLELGLAFAIGAVAIALVVLSGRLIRSEKLLP